MCVSVINHVKQVAGCCWCYSLCLLHMIRKRIMWRISICLLHVRLANPWGGSVCACVGVCVCLPMNKPVGILAACMHCTCVRMCTPPCVFLWIFQCAPTHTAGPSCIWVCKFNVSVFGEGLNNAQRDSKIEWMSVHLLLANFLCDLLPSTTPVTASCDTYTQNPYREYWRQC